MFGKYIDSFLRHAFTGVGGVLIYAGIPEAVAGNFVNAAIPVATGLITYGIGQVSSLLEKKARRLF